MPARQRRYFLKDKETKALLTKITEKLKLNTEQLFEDKTNFEIVEVDFGDVFLVNGKPLMFKTGQEVYPTLAFEKFLTMAPRVVVDMGAIPYVCKGANIMAPGIRRLEGEFGKGDIVLIVDEKHGKTLALGESLQSSEEAKNIKQGPIIKNLHFVSDKVWSYIKQFIN